MMETPMSGRNYVLGADFGSDSVRAVVVDLADGSMCAGSRMHIPKVGRWFVPDARGRDFPAASGGLPRSAGNGCRGSACERPGDGVRRAVRGIAVDTTGSTPCPVDRAGTSCAYKGL